MMVITTHVAPMMVPEEARGQRHPSRLATEQPSAAQSTDKTICTHVAADGHEDRVHQLTYPSPPHTHTTPSPHLCGRRVGAQAVEEDREVGERHGPGDAGQRGADAVDALAKHAAHDGAHEPDGDEQGPGQLVVRRLADVSVHAQTKDDGDDHRALQGLGQVDAVVPAAPVNLREAPIDAPARLGQQKVLGGRARHGAALGVLARGSGCARRQRIRGPRRLELCRRAQAPMVHQAWRAACAPRAEGLGSQRDRGERHELRIERERPRGADAQVGERCLNARQESAPQRRRGAILDVGALFLRRLCLGGQILGESLGAQSAVATQGLGQARGQPLHGALHHQERGKHRHISRAPWRAGAGLLILQCGQQRNESRVHGIQPSRHITRVG